MKLYLILPLATVTLAAPLVRTVTIGPATIVLEETTFASAARQLGEAPLSQTGDAGGFRVQACYRSAGEAATTYYLDSEEMGGGNYITQVDVVGAGSVTASEEPVLSMRCGLLRSKSRAKTNTGMRLGMSRRELERRLRSTGRDSAGVTIYERLESRGTGVSAYDISSWIRVRYTGGRVAAFSARRITST